MREDIHEQDAMIELGAVSEETKGGVELELEERDPLI
jgi:hypothetical protein